MDQKPKVIQQPAAQSGIFKIGGHTPVHRLGFGAMRLTGKGIWGEPEDPAECIAVLRRAVDLGINLIDTADSYGPFVSERLIAQALHPYPKGVVIATKAGLQRPGPDQWEPDGRPEYLRERCEGSLRRLKLDRIELFQLHRIDAKVPLEDQIGILVALQNEGKIRHIGLSEVSVEQIRTVQRLTPIAPCKINTTSSNDAPRMCSNTAHKKASVSSHGFHLRLERWPTLTVCWHPPLDSLGPHPARSRWRGCSRNRRSYCQFLEHRRWSTSKATPSQPCLIRMTA